VTEGRSHGLAEALDGRGVARIRFARGQAFEIRNHRDDVGLMTQVGAPIFACSANQRSADRA